MKAEMRYYVIYSIETQEKISRVKPNYIKGKGWKLTESGKSEDIEPDRETGKKWNHRKYCAFLTAEQLNKILKEESFDTCNTMGAITKFGWLSAISFNFEDEWAWRNAYISIIPSDETDNAVNEALEKLPEIQKNLVLTHEIQPKLESLLEQLKELESVGINDEIGLPDSLEFNLKQFILEMNYHDEKEVENEKRA
jgi:hypothetical protein